MRKKTQLICIGISLVLTIAPSFYCMANEIKKEAADGEIISLLNENSETKSYYNYISEYKTDNTDSISVTVSPSAFTETDGAEVLNSYEGKDGNIVTTPESGYVKYSFEIPKTGLYSIKLNYYPMKGTGGPIQRSLLIDGKLPFEEANNIQFGRVFKDSEEIKTDKQGNDIRPSQTEVPRWITSYVRDQFGLFGNQLQFYLTQGSHTLTLLSLAEPMAISNITLEKSIQSIKEYKDALSCWQKEGLKPVSGVLDNGFQIIQAENTYEKSDKSLYPVSDTSSPANQPYSIDKIRLNTVGGTRWQNPGQWISWQINTPKSGLYEIGFRSRQDYVRDVNAQRSLYINGELPFKESENLSFPFHSGWTVGTAGEKEPYLFYLKEGLNTISMEVTLGEYADPIMRADSSLEELNSASWRLLTILGNSPDTNRDYEIKKYMPDVVKTFEKQAGELKSVVKQLVSMSGNEDANVAQINQLIYLLEQMSADTSKIPGAFLNFRSTLSNFANMLLNMKQQPLEFDYLFIAEKNAKLPKDSTGFFASFKNGFLKFFYSFFIDYNQLSSSSLTNSNKELIKVWIGNGITGGRDQADALSQLIQQDFSVSSEIPVKLQLVSSSQLMTPSTLLSATATGTGPDVALQLQGSEPVNYAMRNALVNLRDFDDFETVISRFSKEAIIPYSYNGGVYALPETVSFPMLFYRKDILLSLGIDIESIQTWQDLIALLPILQVKHMNMALPANNYTYTMLLYQKNESLYKDNFEKTNLNSKAALDSFDTLMKFYTDYNLPFSYNFVTRFRTGEIPIGIDDYTSYNLLKISAPEIAGQWGMRTVPGTADTNGSINNSVPISGNSFGCAMMAASKGKKSAWEFMKWWADSNTQIKFGEELESVMGIGARYNTANMEALQKLPWQVQEKTALMTQMESLKGIPEVPGGYQTARNIEFAMNTVYNTGKDPRKVLLSYVDQINREISIKRSEFGLSQGGK